MLTIDCRPYERKNQKKELIKSKLEKLYAPIYSEVFLIQTRLIADAQITEYDIRESESSHKLIEPVIMGPFDEIFDSISKVVLDNVYLLDDNDLKLWIKFEEATEDLEESLLNEDGSSRNLHILLAERYICFKSFIDNSVESYEKYRNLYTKQ